MTTATLLTITAIAIVGAVMLAVLACCKMAGDCEEEERREDMKRKGEQHGNCK